jgi:hypothetical protein
MSSASGCLEELARPRPSTSNARVRAQRSGRSALFVITLVGAPACDGGGRLRDKLATPPNIALGVPAGLPKLPPGAALTEPNGCATSASFAWRAPHELVIACGNRVITLDPNFRVKSEIELVAPTVDSISASSASRRLLIRHGLDWAVLDDDAAVPVATGTVDDASTVAQLSPSGSAVAWVARDQSLRLRDLAAAIELRQPRVDAFAWGATDYQLLLCNQDRKLALWSPGKGAPRALASTDYCAEAAFSHSGEVVVNMSHGVLRRWAKRGAELPLLDLRRLRPPTVEGFNLVADSDYCTIAAPPILLGGDLLRIGADESSLEAIDLSAPAQTKWAQSMSGQLADLRAAPDGAFVAARCANTICVWHSDTGERQPLPGGVANHAARIIGLVRSRNNALVAALGADGWARAWDLERGSLASVEAVTQLDVQRSYHLVGGVVSGAKLCTQGAGRDHALLVSHSASHAMLLDGPPATRATTWVYARGNNKWSAAPEIRAGAFLDAGLLASRSGKVVLLNDPLQAANGPALVSSIVPTQIVASSNGCTVALQASDGFEIRDGYPPFAQRVHRKDRTIDTILSLSDGGRCVLGRRGLWCQPDGRIIEVERGTSGAFTTGDRLIGTYEGHDVQLSIVDGMLKARPLEQGVFPAVRDYPELWHWNEGAESPALGAGRFTWAPRWFLSADDRGGLELRRAPGQPLLLTIRAIDHVDAGYVFTPQGHFDLAGGDPQRAAPFIRCTVDGAVREGATECESLRVHGLLPRVMAGLGADQPRRDIECRPSPGDN